MRLARRAFDLADQKQFAGFTGDCNPMHLDALQARRTQAGAPVVHGVHLLLWALDSLSLAQPDLLPMQSLRVQFNNFVYLDEPVQAVLVDQGPAHARLKILVDNSLRAKVTIVFGPISTENPAWGDSPLEPIPFSTAASNLELEQILGLSGRFSFVAILRCAEATFPAASRWLGARRVAALAASSYLVGMICPGLHSVYGELSINSTREINIQDFMAFRVSETDLRFRSVEQEIVGGGMAGIVKSFARVPPVRQATMQSLAGLVGPTDYVGSLALIVGGSRGLGELTAKLIASGGGRVIVTWQSGREDAESVAREITSSGGVCETMRYDASEPVSEQLRSRKDTPTHAYYFATPSIFRPQSDLFVWDRLNEFLSVYVDGFWRLSQFLRDRQPRLSIFYPSSVAVAERPKGMTEYSMAKAAGEALCADMNVSQGPMHVTMRRLPRLPTDQTAAVTALEMTDPVETMLAIVREVQSWPK